MTGRVFQEFNFIDRCLIRYACIKLAQENLEKFLTIAGIELAGKTFSGIGNGRFIEQYEPTAILFTANTYLFSLKGQFAYIE